MLYLIPTPIGNLSDITLRALSVLKDVNVILAEDTRKTKFLMDKFNIVNQLESYHAHNEHKKVSSLITRLSTGEDMALVTDAGTPGFSDPGYLLVSECYKNNISVTSLPGACAFTTALSGAGLPVSKVLYLGFLPHKKGRNSLWKEIKDFDGTTVLYESPHRILKCLREIKTHLGAERIVCVAKEISKLHEEYIRSSAEELLRNFKERKKIRGEFVVIIAPSGFTLE